MKREEQRIFAGGLNLLTPSDKTPENDAIDLRNWRVDQAGVLRGADTFWRLGRAPNHSPVHTIYKLDDFSTTQAYTNGMVPISFGGYSGIQYSVRGAFLVGAGTNLYYWANGAFQTTPLATGFSGKRISIIVWNGFIWVLDSLQQLKIDPAILTGIFPGTAVSPWLPAIPATAISATANTTGNGPLVGSFTYYCTYVTYGFPTLSSGFLTAHESPLSPAVTVTAMGGAVAVQAIPYSATVDAIRVYRQQGGGAIQFVQQFGQGVDPTGTYCLTQLTATYPSVDSPWVDTIASPVATFVSTSGGPAAPGLGTVVEGGFGVSSSSGLVGAYQWYLTYVNSAGLESNPSPVSASVTPSNGLADLTWAAPPSGQDIKRQRLYRTGGTLGNAYQVIEFADATTTSYTDGIPDLTVTQLGIQMPTTNDPPPSGVASDDMGMIGPYFNYLIYWKNGRMGWSQDGVPLFPGSADAEVTGNWVNVGLPDDRILDMTMHSQVLGIYKARTVWTVYGDIITGQLTQSGATNGIQGKGCVANCGTFDLALSSDGVYKFDMYAIHDVSEKVSPVFMGQRWLKPGFSDIAQGQRGQDLWGTAQLPFATAVTGTAVLGNGGGSVGDIQGAAFLYHPEAERWAAFTSNYGTALTAALSYANAYIWFAGDASGFLLMSRQAAGTYPCIWQTRFLDQGLGDTPKDYQEIVLDMELHGATANVWLLTDATETAPALSTITAPYRSSFTSTARQKFYIPIPEDWGDLGPYHLSVRVEINALDPTGDSLSAGVIPPAIHGLYIYWATEERDASIRGAQVLDFRSERVQMAQRFEVDMAGQANIVISTDLPDGLSQRFVFHGPSTGRGVYEFKCPPNLRGRLWRLDVLPQGTGPTPTARVYSVRAWMREMGTVNTEQWSWKEFVRGVDAELPEVE